MEKITLSILLWALGAAPILRAADTIMVADQTTLLDGAEEHAFGFAEGDQILIEIWPINGKKIRSARLIAQGDKNLFEAREFDNLTQGVAWAPAFGVYRLRLEEKGASKKLCRFVLRRIPKSEETRLFNTRIDWNYAQYPECQVRKRAVVTGHKIELAQISGQVTVPAGKLGIKKPVNAYFFSLPPHTQRWAYRISVGQAGAEARAQDAQKFSSLLKAGSLKALPVQPETALAAFALGVAIDLTVRSSAGDDVNYALVDETNLALFYDEKPYKAHMSQSRVAADAQRRYTPTEGSWYFAFRNPNWVNDIGVLVEIEAVVETPIYGVESWLEPLKP